MSNRPKSKCCQSKFHPAKKDCGIGETNFYVCDNCGNPCDLIFPILKKLPPVEIDLCNPFGVKKPFQVCKDCSFEARNGHSPLCQEKNDWDPNDIPFSEKDFEDELNNEFQNDCIAQEQKVFG